MVKQNIILSLIQQLSVDLKQDSAIKYRYLQDAVLSLGKLITFEWKAFFHPSVKKAYESYRISTIDQS